MLQAMITNYTQVPIPYCSADGSIMGFLPPMLEKPLVMPDTAVMMFGANESDPNLGIPGLSPANVAKYQTFIDAWKARPDVASAVTDAILMEIRIFVKVWEDDLWFTISSGPTGPVKRGDSTQVIVPGWIAFHGEIPVAPPELLEA